MKSKLRTIVVNDQSFIWRVVRPKQSHVILRVWIEGQKQLPWAEITCRIDDPWLSFNEGQVIGSLDSKEDSGSATLLPKEIAEIIRMLSQQHGLAVFASPHRYMFDRGSKLVPNTATVP
jgi:hypothetical protein